MNRKQLVLLLLAGLVLGGIGVYVGRQKSASFQRVAKIASEHLLGDFPVNDVAQLTIRRGTNEVNLVRTEGWTVRERNQYPAGAADIVELARKLWDLRAAQSQKIGPSQLGRLELLPPDAGTNSATQVELKGHDGKPIRTLLLGRQSLRGGGGGDPFGGGGWPNGRWVYLPDQPGAAYLVSESFSEIEPRPERWLKKDFFRIEKPRSVAVEFPVATNSWKLTRESEAGDWKLADAKAGEQLDSAKAASVSNPLGSPTFTDVLPGDQAGGTGTNAPVVVKIETFDGFAYTIKVGQQTNDEYRLTVAVAAVIEKERTPGKDEKPEDKARLDKEFKERQLATASSGCWTAPPSPTARACEPRTETRPFRKRSAPCSTSRVTTTRHCRRSKRPLKRATTP